MSVRVRVRVRVWVRNASFVSYSAPLETKVSGKGKQSEFYQPVHEVPENIGKFAHCYGEGEGVGDAG